MDVLKLIIGLFFIFLSVGYILYRLIFKSKEIKKSDYLMMSAQFQIYIGFFILFLCGIVLIYKELS